MTGRQLKATQDLTGESLGKKILQAVREMKSGKSARVTTVTPNQVAAARQ